MTTTHLDHDTLMQLAADAGLNPESIRVHSAMLAVERAARAAERERWARVMTDTADALQRHVGDSSQYAVSILRDLSGAIRRDPPEPEGQNKALWLADEPTRMPSRQYYYKDSRCKADNSDAPNCICWHDEGTGPRKAESTGARLRWRYAR